jgi:FHS family glucose/mannose:H+ symporter-like MFS transporter
VVGTLSFVLFGALLVLVGASQDELQAALDLDLARTGLLASTVIVGVGVGVVAGGPLVDRAPRRLLFCFAAGIAGVALCLVGPDSGFETVAALLLLAGVGGGLYETILNAAAIERYEDRSVRVLAVMHSGATLGAMLTPLGVTWLLAHADWTLAFRVVGTAHLALAVTALGAAVGAPHATHERGRILTAPLVFLFVAAFAYIGVESTITAFAVPYARDALDLGADRGRTAISVFWLGLLAGRLAFALLPGHDDARAAAIAGGVAGLSIALGVGLGWHLLEVLLGVVGFAMGGVFPLLVVLAGRRTPHATGAGVAIVAGYGSAGGFVVPWATGLVGDTAGVRAGIGTLALWCGLLVLAAVLAEFTHRRTDSQHG